MALLPISAFEEKRAESIALLKTLVEYESPTTSKYAVDRLGAFLAEQFRALGAHVVVDQQSEVGDHILARWGNGTDGILLLGHMDTVYELGTLARQPCIEQEGHLLGPGVLDMKSGIVIILTALRAINERSLWNDRPITVLITSDEETGSWHSRAIIEQLAKEARLVLVLEPGMPDGAIKTWHKGVGNFEIAVRGKAAHAGADHQKGLNAIEELAYQVVALQKLTDYERGTTVNVGYIQGGSRSNVVPEEAHALVDVRFLTPEEATRIDHTIKSLQTVLSGVVLDVKGGINRPPMVRDAQMLATYEKARALAKKLGFELGENGTGGASDANFIAPLGIPVLDGMGGIGRGLHSDWEYIDIASLPARCALAAAILTAW